MKFCTNCGNPVTPEQKFCTKCGNALAKAEPPVAGETLIPQPVEAVVEVVPEPEPEPEPAATQESAAPTPTPSREYANVLEIFIALGKEGFVSDVLDEPADLAENAKNAWSDDSLGAVVHKSGASEYVVVFATDNIAETEYSSIFNASLGKASASHGNWVITVAQIAGPSNDSERQLERVQNLLG